MAKPKAEKICLSSCRLAWLQKRHTARSSAPGAGGGGGGGGAAGGRPIDAPGPPFSASALPRFRLDVRGLGGSAAQHKPNSAALSARAWVQASLPSVPCLHRRELVVIHFMPSASGLRPFPAQKLKPESGRAAHAKLTENEGPCLIRIVLREGLPRCWCQHHSFIPLRLKQQHARTTLQVDLRAPVQRKIPLVLLAGPVACAIVLPPQCTACMPQSDSHLLK